MADETTPDAMMTVGVEADLSKAIKQLQGLPAEAKKISLSPSVRIDPGSVQQLETLQIVGMRRLRAEAKRTFKELTGGDNPVAPAEAAVRTRRHLETYFNGMADFMAKSEPELANVLRGVFSRAADSAINEVNAKMQSKAARLAGPTRRPLDPIHPAYILNPGLQKGVSSSGVHRFGKDDLSESSIKKAVSELSVRKGLVGEDLFQAAKSLRSEFESKAKNRYGEGSAGHLEIRNVLRNAFSGILESRASYDPESENAIARDVLRSISGPGNSRLSDRSIRGGLEVSLGQIKKTRTELNKELSSASNQIEKKEIKEHLFDNERQEIEVVRRLNRLKSLGEERLAIQEKLKTVRGKIGGGIREILLNRELRRNLSERDEISGAGSVRGKTSAHGAQFAAMNAAYGFQDFFQVLAQPGMGPGRAFLAAANNIGPALAMVGGSAVGATVAIGGLMGVMAAANYVMDKGQKKADDLTKRFSDLADAINRAALNRAEFDIGTLPAGESTGSSGWLKTLSEAIQSPVSAKGQSESLQRYFLRDEKDKAKKWAGGETVWSSISDKWSKLFSLGVEIPESEMEAIYPRPRPLSRIKKTGRSQSLPQVNGPSDAGLFYRQFPGVEVLENEKGLSDAISAYEKFWSKGGAGEKIKKQIEDSYFVIETMKRVSSKSGGIIAEIISGADGVRKESESLGVNGRGMYERYINSALGDLPGNKKILSEMRQSAENKRKQWEKENGDRFRRLQGDAASKSRQFSLAKGDSVSQSEEDRRLLSVAPRHNGRLDLVSMQRGVSESNAMLAGLRAEKEAIDKTVSAIDEIIKQSEIIPEELMKKDRAGRIIAKRLVPGFDSSGVVSTVDARNEIASGLKEFQKLSSAMPESEKNFFKYRTSVMEFGDIVAKQKMKLSEIYSSIDSFQVTNIGLDVSANRNFGRYKASEAGGVLGFDIETSRQKIEAVSRSSDLLSFAIERIGSSSGLSADEIKSMQSLREAGSLGKKRSIESSDPIERSLNYVHMYREALAGFDSSVREYALRASASGGKFTESSAKLAKFEEVASKLGITLSFNEQMSDFQKMVNGIRNAMDLSGVSPKRKSEIESQLGFIEAGMRRASPEEAAKRGAMGGRTGMFGDAGNSAKNLSDKLFLLRQEMDFEKKRPEVNPDDVETAYRNRVLGELESFAVSLAGFNLSTKDELERFDLAISEMVKQMEKENMSAKDVSKVKADAARKREEILWNDPNAVVKRSLLGGRSTGFGASSNAAAENFSDQLKLMADEFSKYLKTTNLDQSGVDAATKRNAREIDKFIADFASSLGVVPSFKENVAAFDESMKKLIEAMKKNGKSQEEIDIAIGIGGIQRRRMQRESDSAKAERGVLGGRPDEYLYGGTSGKIANFFDRIRSMQMDLSAELDNQNLSEKDKERIRKKHERGVHAEISGLGLGGSGKTQMVDSGSLWNRIQESLGGNQMLEAERRQVELLTRIHEALVNGRSPSGAAGRMMNSFMLPVDPEAVGHDSGGYAGSGKKPSARDTILAKLRAGEVVLTPEHQARLAQRLKMSPQDLFGGMGMTSKALSLSAWANVGGFDGGGLVGGMRFSSMLDGGFRKWQKQQDAYRAYADRQSRNYENEEPFRDRYSQYKLQSGRLGLSGFYRNQGVPLYGRGSGSLTRYSGYSAPSFSEAWPGGMPFISAPGISLNLPREGRSLASFEEMKRRSSYSTGVRFNRKVAESGLFPNLEEKANSMQLEEMKRMGFSQRSVDVMAGVQSGSAERAAEARRAQSDYMNRKAAQSVRKEDYQAAAKKAEQERLERKAAAQKEAEARTRAAKEAYKNRVEEERKRVKSGSPVDPEIAADIAAKAEAGRERLRKKLQEKADKEREDFTQFHGSHVAGESREKNRKETLGERLVRENEERFSKFEKENPSSGGGAASSAGMTPGERALQDQKDRLNAFRGGLGDKMEGSFPVNPGDLPDSPPVSSRTVLGGDRLGRWRAGQADDRRMREEGNRLQMDAYKTHFDELPGKLMQNVSGKEQAAAGVGFSGEDRHTAILEKIATILEGTDKNSTKHSEAVLNAIESSGISIY